MTRYQAKKRLSIIKPGAHLKQRADDDGYSVTLYTASGIMLQHCHRRTP